MTDATVENPQQGKKQQSDDRINQRASLIDTETTMTTWQSLVIVGRTMQILRYFWGRFTIKFVVMGGALLFPVTILPWPIKMIVDHVVLDAPIADAKNYPFFIDPLINYMIAQQMTAWDILVFLTICFVFMVVLVGAFAPEANDTTEAGMFEGFDEATRQENRVHGGHSFAGGFYGYFEFLMNMRLTQSVVHTMRSNLFEKIKALPVTTLEDQRIGDAVYRVMYDVPSVNYIFYEVINRPLMSTIVFVLAAGTMFSAYPEQPAIIWMTLALIPLYLASTVFFSGAMRRRGQMTRASGTITTSTIEEGMDNVLAVQSLGGNEKERARFDEDSKESFKRHRAVIILYIAMGQLRHFSFLAIQMTVFFFISSLVIEGDLTVGDYGSLWFYFYWMRGPVDSVSWLWINLQEHAAGMRRVYALMDLPKEEDMGTRELPPITQGVTFENVGLTFPDGRRALTDVSLTADVGQIVAFVGPTGAGKTSLAYMIPRFRVATDGSVSIDGINVNDVTMTSLRQQVTYVFQETQLFSDSIIDNIRFGQPDASEEEVERVARIAGIHDFIHELPEGYGTLLGTTMSKLSVGQKQRIAIARGLLRESRILILDEPTSALDPETEQYLVQSLHEAARNRLVIIIAHRLSTIAHADKIVFLEEGQFREAGSHEELMAIDDGYYRRFVDLQTVHAD